MKWLRSAEENKVKLMADKLSELSKKVAAVVDVLHRVKDIISAIDTSSRGLTNKVPRITAVVKDLVGSDPKGELTKLVIGDTLTLMDTASEQIEKNIASAIQRGEAQEVTEVVEVPKPPKVEPPPVEASLEESFLRFAQDLGWGGLIDTVDGLGVLVDDFYKLHGKIEGDILPKYEDLYSFVNKIGLDIPGSVDALPPNFPTHIRDVLAKVKEKFDNITTKYNEYKQEYVEKEKEWRKSPFPGKKLKAPSEKFWNKLQDWLFG